MFYVLFDEIKHPNMHKIGYSRDCYQSSGFFITCSVSLATETVIYYHMVVGKGYIFGS